MDVLHDATLQSWPDGMAADVEAERHVQYSRAAATRRGWAFTADDEADVRSMLAMRGVLPVPTEVVEWAASVARRPTASFADVLAAFRGPKVRVKYGLRPSHGHSGGGATPSTSGAAGTVDNTPQSSGGNRFVGARTSLAMELQALGYDESLVHFIVGACDGTLDNARRLLRLAGGRPGADWAGSASAKVEPVDPRPEYVRRSHAELGIDVEVVDPGVIAGPAARTNACQFLSCIMGASRVLVPGSAVPDQAVWQSIQADVLTVRATDASALRSHGRLAPRTDALGVAADYLRGHVCSQMRGLAGLARWLPSFALTSGAVNAPGGGGANADDFHRHVRDMRSISFADHQTFPRQQNSVNA